MKAEELTKALDILRKAKCNMSHQDYVNIWGDHVGTHIWRQEGSDLLRIWKSGLTKGQADKFVNYILNKYN